MRLFVAIELDDEIKNVLRVARRNLRAFDDAMRDLQRHVIHDRGTVEGLADAVDPDETRALAHRLLRSQPPAQQETAR